MFAVTANTHRWVMLMDHFKRNDATKILLAVSLGYSQLAVGSGTQILSLDYKSHQRMVQETWIKQLWGFIDACGAKMHIPT